MAIERNIWELDPGDVQEKELAEYPRRAGGDFGPLERETDWEAVGKIQGETRAQDWRERMELADRAQGDRDRAQFERAGRDREISEGLGRALSPDVAKQVGLDVPPEIAGGASTGNPTLDLIQRYRDQASAGGAERGPEMAPAATPALGGTSIIDKLMGEYGKDVDYLGGEPFTGLEEQQWLEKRNAGVRDKYAGMRRQLTDELGARQGFSGVLAGELGKLTQEEARESSEAQRDLGVLGMSERRSRLGERRGILGGLEGLERSRSAEAIGLQQMADQDRRQRFMDVLSLIRGGAPDLGTAGALGSSILDYAQKTGAAARGAQAATYGGLGDLAQLYWLTKGK